MAKKISSDSSSNGFNAVLVKKLVQQIESGFADLEIERGTYMQRCKAVRGRITGIFEDAKGLGIPTAELKAVIKTRRFEAKASAAREALEAEEREIFDNIREALGDYAETPLGAAAVEAAESQEETQAETNVRRLKGMKQPAAE